MASKPGMLSRDLPPELSQLMNRLTAEATSFIQQFARKEPRMREIVEELQKICREVKRVQEMTDKVRTGGAKGAVGGGVTLGLGILAAPFTGGLSLIATAGLAGLAAAGGGAAVVGSNIKKMWSESGNAKKVEELGNEFKQIVEPLKRILEEVKETCEKLKLKAAEAQSGDTLTTEGFEEILRRVSEVKQQSLEALHASESLIVTLENLLILIVDVFRVTTVKATPEEDRKLRESITQSAHQSQDVTDEFKKTQNLLKEILHW